MYLDFDNDYVIERMNSLKISKEDIDNFTEEDNNIYSLSEEK